MNGVADQRDAWGPPPDLLDRAKPFNSVERPEDRNIPVARDHVREDQHGVAVLAAAGVDGAEKARADQFPMPSLRRRQRIEKPRRSPDCCSARENGADRHSNLLTGPDVRGSEFDAEQQILAA